MDFRFEASFLSGNFKAVFDRNLVLRTINRYGIPPDLSYHIAKAPSIRSQNDAILNHFDRVLVSKSGQTKSFVTKMATFDFGRSGKREKRINQFGANDTAKLNAPPNLDRLWISAP